MSNNPVSASSATLRKAVNGISEATGKKPVHTRYPSLDFDAALADIPDAMKTMAIEWYIRGIKRGMAKATDLMLEGSIYKEAEIIHAPPVIKLNVRIKFKGEEWKSLPLRIKSKEIGFD